MPKRRSKSRTRSRSRSKTQVARRGGRLRSPQRSPIKSYAPMRRRRSPQPASYFVDAEPAGMSQFRSPSRRRVSPQLRFNALQPVRFDNDEYKPAYSVGVAVTPQAAADLIQKITSATIQKELQPYTKEIQDFMRLVQSNPDKYGNRVNELSGLTARDMLSHILKTNLELSSNLKSAVEPFLEGKGNDARAKYCTVFGYHLLDKEKRDLLSHYQNISEVDPGRLKKYQDKYPNENYKVLERDYKDQTEATFGGKRRMDAMKDRVDKAIAKLTSTEVLTAGRIVRGLQNALNVFSLDKRIEFVEALGKKSGDESFNALPALLGNQGPGFQNYVKAMSADLPVPAKQLTLARLYAAIYGTVDTLDPVVFANHLSELENTVKDLSDLDKLKMNQIIDDMKTVGANDGNDGVVPVIRVAIQQLVDVFLMELKLKKENEKIANMKVLLPFPNPDLVYIDEDVIAPSSYIDPKSEEVFKRFARIIQSFMRTYNEELR